eukprot:2794711-Rhodomonas_salina.1
MEQGCHLIFPSKEEREANAVEMGLAKPVHTLSAPESLPDAVDSGCEGEAGDVCSVLPSPPPKPPSRVQPCRSDRFAEHAEQQRHLKSLSQDSLTSSQEEAVFGLDSKLRAQYRRKKGKVPSSAATI